TLAITFLGVVLGPPTFGAVSAFFGSYQAGFAALAVPLVLCALVLWRVPRSS
ncbi:MAG: putative transporter, partial [Ramlibacter sp.]|nr:putative transporter [Ramlibacter sp.]